MSSFTSSSSSDLYSRSALYAPEDILNVSKAEDQEQQRRISDIEGENTKRVLANNLSILFHESVRATWFQRGSSFVLSLLGSVRSAVALKANDITSTISHKAGDLGHQAALKISHTAEDLGNKAQGAVFNASQVLSDKAGEVGLNLAHKAEQTAHDVSASVSAQANNAALNIKEKSVEAGLNLAHKADQTAHDVSAQANNAALNIKEKSVEVGLNLAHKADQTAHDVSSTVSAQASSAALTIKEKSLETAHNVSSLAQEKASDLKNKSVEAAQGASSLLSSKVHEYTQWLKSAVINMSFYKRLGNLTGHTNMTFAMIESENERRYRMTSSGEIHAIQNALKVASLIKELHPALYRPSSEPNIHFATRLLEESERSRRISEDKSDKAAIVNAKSIADLIIKKQPAASAEQLYFKIKPELAEEIKQKPFAAAM